MISTKLVLRSGPIGRQRSKLPSWTLRPISPFVLRVQSTYLPAPGLNSQVPARNGFVANDKRAMFSFKFGHIDSILDSDFSSSAPNKSECVISHFKRTQPYTGYSPDECARREAQLYVLRHSEVICGAERIADPAQAQARTSPRYCAALSLSGDGR